MQVYIKGGQYRRKIREDFFVEEGVKRMEVSWFTNAQPSKLTLIDPSGKQYHDFQISEGDGTIQEGDCLYSLSIEAPERGLWTMKAKNGKERYMLQVSFDSPINEQISMDLERDDQIHLYFSAKKPDVNLQNLQVTTFIEYMDIKNRSFQKKTEKNKPGIPKMTIEPFGYGIYNIIVQIIGETAQGSIFNRTVIESIYFGK